MNKCKHGTDTDKEPCYECFPVFGCFVLPAKRVSFSEFELMFPGLGADKKPKED